MRTEQEFDAFYELDLKPGINRHHKKINATALKSAVICATGTAIAFLIIKYCLVGFINLDEVFIYTLGMLITFVAFSIKFFMDLKAEKINMNSWLWGEIVRFAANDTKSSEILKRGQRISDGSLERSRVFDYSQFYKTGANFTSFFYQNTNGMTISDFALYTLVRRNRRNERRYFFKGVFFSLDFQKDIKEDIYLIPKKRMGKNIDVAGREINLENNEITQKYKVFCCDEIEVRKIFTLDFMERINKVSEIFPHTKYFAFRHGRRLSIFIEKESVKKIIEKFYLVWESEKRALKRAKNMLSEAERYIRLHEVLDVEKNRSERILNEIINRNIQRQLDLSETPAGKFNEGCAAALAKDHEKAFIFWASAAQNGHIGALNNLAGAYFKGSGCQEDKNKAFDLYGAAAEKGNDHAVYNVGYCYEHGYGCEVDNDKAFEFYKQAAHLGNVSSMCKLGWCYLNGIGCEKNEQEADIWIKSAAEKGNEKAIKLLNENNGGKE